MSKRRLALILILLVAFWLRVYRLVELPPGLHYDEAANGTLAAAIAFEGYRPIFITSYTGKETLFFYAAAAIMRLVGESVFALRLTSAFAGTLTVAAAYWLGCEIHQLHHRHTKRTRSVKKGIPTETVGTSLGWLGIIMAALLAISFPHLIFSRMGFRAIMQPLLQTVTVAAFLRAIGMDSRPTPSRGQALRGNDRTQTDATMFRELDFPKRPQLTWLILSGIALGLTAYTYLAARLFPLLLGLLFLPLLRKWWRQIGVVIAVAAIVLAPLGWFWVQNPETFWVRIGQVAGEYTFADYANSYWRSLQMLLWQGDPYMRFNVPDRPIFPPYLSIFFIIGYLQLIWQAVRAKSAEYRAVLLFLLATPFVMILPTALALGEIVPSNLRAIGLFPFILVPIGFALSSIKEWIPAFAGMTGLKGRKSNRNNNPVWQIGLLFTVYCLLFTLSYQTYFTNWGTRTDNFYESDADLVALAEFIDGSDEPIYVSSLHYQHPTLAFTSERYDEIKWILESNAVVLAPEGGLIAYPNSSPPPTSFAFGQLVAQPLGLDGAPLFTVYDLASTSPTSPAVASTANFSNVIRLNGYALLNADSEMPTVRLFWDVIGTPSQDYTPFVHILDETGYRWAQAEANAYPSPQWAVGEQIVQDVTLALPAGMPTALFNVEVGLFSGTDRLPLVNEAGQFAGSVLRIENIALAGNSGVVASIGERVIDGLGLDAVDVGLDAVEAGTRLLLTLNWSADRELPTQLRYQITHNDAILYAGQPVRGQFPFGEWETPRMVTDRIDPLISADSTPTTAPLFLKVYDDDTLLFEKSIGNLTIEPTVRQFDQPDFETASDAQFGESIRLAGYTVTDETVRLVWQAIAPPKNDYTVFVHILNPDGTCCVWQLDRIPRGDYATTRWVAGEYIVDEYAIEGSGLIEIGLYDPTTGVRLLVKSADVPIRDFYYLQDDSPTSSKEN